MVSLMKFFANTDRVQEMNLYVNVQKSEEVKESRVSAVDWSVPKQASLTSLPPLSSY